MSSNLPSERVAILATSAVLKCDAWNVFITVSSPTIWRAKWSSHRALRSSPLRVIPTPMAFWYLVIKGWKVWNQLTRSCPLYRIRALILFLSCISALLLSQVHLSLWSMISLAVNIVELVLNAFVRCYKGSFNTLRLSRRVYLYDKSHVGMCD